MAKIRLKYRRSPHQREFSDDLESKFLHLSSGFGGGKSYALAMKAFELSRVNKDIPGGCVVPSLPEYKRDLLPIIEEILDVNKISYRYHQTDKWFRFPWSSGKMYIATAEKKIRGPNWGWCVINEAGLITHERFKEAIGRVRIKRSKFPQIASSGTPEGTSHWLYDVFVENPMPRSRIIYGDTRANLRNLADDYISTLESSYDPIMLDAYLRGLFVNMNGARFYYAYDPAKNDDKTIEQIPGAEVYVSLDYNVAPMVATFWHVLRVTNKDGVPLMYPNGQPLKRAIAFDSVEILDGADIHKMDRALRARGLEPESTWIYPDPAGRARNSAVDGALALNTILKDKGWRIKVKTAAPHFRRRQLATNNLLAKGLIKVHPTKCKPLRKDLMAVEQDAATLEKIKDNPALTHASDGMDYFVDIEFPFSGHKPESRSTKYR